ncbi:MAG TPA: hypothetical protein VHC22_05160 [Pirellulales bacterium]|nr:hypothetical protein [Pirellulales bacterium]
MFCRADGILVGGTVLLSATMCVGEGRIPGRSATSTVETANFRIYGVGRLAGASRLGVEFESLRERLCRTWLADRTLLAWSPKCDVVVHATADSYRRAVGQAGFTTGGVSRIDVAGGRVSLRRIDVRADRAGWFAAVVPHELTHVILADEFLADDLPNWADEGMAVLADTPLKQSLHLRDIRAGHFGGATFRLAAFVAQSCYPAPEQIPVFYGQSASLVKFLVERRSSADFVRFLHRAEKLGYDAALAEMYDLRGVGELERAWLRWLSSPADGHGVATLAPVERPASPQKEGA